jgi:hypothetical protein
VNLRLREDDEPLPVHRQKDVGPAVIGDVCLQAPLEPDDVVVSVVLDFEDRIRLGIERYDKPLQTFNGRVALRDLYQELLDAAHYAKQDCMETEDPVVLRMYYRTLSMIFTVRKLMQKRGIDG